MSCIFPLRVDGSPVLLYCFCFSVFKLVCTQSRPVSCRDCCHCHKALLGDAFQIKISFKHGNETRFRPPFSSEIVSIIGIFFHCFTVCRLHLHSGLLHLQSTYFLRSVYSLESSPSPSVNIFTFFIISSLTYSLRSVLYIHVTRLRRSGEGEHPQGLPPGR